jgi:hypothetical protein
MGLSLEDYAPRFEELEQAHKVASELQKRAKQLRQTQLRELLVDPKWELYAQEIDDRLTTATNACEGLQQKLLEGSVEDFKKLMPDYRYNLGIKKAFEEALAIIKRTQAS